MRSRVLRRWLALCAVLALSLGLVANGLAAADMDAKMTATAAAGDMAPSSGGCDGCGGDDGGMLAAGCYALCGGIVAVLPSVSPLEMAAAEQPRPPAVRFEPGRDGSPDPQPPRASALS